MNATPATTPYGKRFLIRNSNGPAYVFPEATAGITQDHIDRFFVLQDIFQRNIEKSRDPCIDSGEISYLLRLCGSLENAIPSLVVCCPPQKLTKIESLFNQPQVKSQYESDITTPNSVRLGLFFWPGVNIWLALHEFAVVIPEELDSGDSVPDVVAGLMPWGLRILEGDRGVQHTATVGCVLQVGHKRFGLTTAHIFKGGIGEVSRGKLPLPSMKSLGRAAELGQRQVYAPPPLEHSSKWIKEHANLDWAAFQLVSNDDQLPPYATESEALPIAEHLPEKCTDVLIITLSSPGVPATLYHIPSYIGGVKGSPAAEVWTVGCLPEEACESQPCHSSGATSWKLTLYLPAIRKGDSGSLVVDARSGELYGMVVAVNPFGDIHIAPLVAVLAQAKKLFEDEHPCVLKAPRCLDPFMLGPSLQAKNPVESQETSDMIVGGRVLPFAPEESLPERAHLVMHQTDVRVLEQEDQWPQAISPLAKEPYVMETRAGLEVMEPESPRFLPTLVLDWFADVSGVPSRGIRFMSFCVLIIGFIFAISVPLIVPIIFYVIDPSYSISLSSLISYSIVFIVTGLAGIAVLSGAYHSRLRAPGR